MVMLESQDGKKQILTEVDTLKIAPFYKKRELIMPYGMGPAGWKYHLHGYGRGWCWKPWGYGAPVPPWGPPTQEEEIRCLEEEANFLREQLSQIEKRLEELKK